MGLTVSGLGSSGIDVGSLVTQLMAAERAPQDRLSAQKTAALGRQTTWGSIKTQVTQLQAAVEAVRTPAVFNTSTVTSSNTNVLSATATGSATAASVTLQVQSLAAAEQRATAGHASTSTPVGTGTLLIAGGAGNAGITALSASGIADGRHTLTVKTGAESGGTATVMLDGTEHTVDLTSPTVSFGGLTLDTASLKTGAVVDFTTATTNSETTLAGLSGLLGSYGGPASAAAVDLGSGTDPARLVLSANKAGTANGLLVSGSGDLAALASGVTVTKPASDAVVSMGSLTVTRSTNTIADLIPGVTLNLQSAKPNEDVTLSVGRDPAGTGGKVKALVDTLNGTLDMLAKNSAYDVATRTKSALTGDPRVRQLTRDLSEMGSVLGSGTTVTMSQLGISFSREGRYTFDAAAFQKQLTADPDGVAKLVSSAAEGMVGKLDDALGRLGKTGWISTAQEGEKAAAANLQNRIDDWDVRLESMEKRYRSQWAAVDSAINSLNSQRSWLTSTIAGLPSYGTR